MSYHTIELSKKLLNYEEYIHIDEALEHSNGKYYNDKKEYQRTMVCETLQHNGIIIKMRTIRKKEFTYHMIYYRINPRRVMDDNNYIGLFDAKQTNVMLNKVDRLIEGAFAGSLPHVNSMKLNRIDFCKNIELESQEQVCCYIDLLKRGRILKKYELQKYDNPVAKRKTLSKNGLTYKGSNDVNIIYYNKYRQMEQQNLPGINTEVLNRILRVEIQCGKKKIKRLQTKYKINTVQGFLNNSDMIGKYVFRKYAGLFCGNGNFYKLNAVRKRIESSDFNKKTKTKLCELAEKSATHSSLQKAIEYINNKYGKDSVNKLLIKFEKLHVSPVIIPKRCKYQCLENIFSADN